MCRMFDVRSSAESIEVYSLCTQTVLNSRWCSQTKIWQQSSRATAKDIKSRQVPDRGSVVVLEGRAVRWEESSWNELHTPSLLILLIFLILYYYKATRSHWLTHSLTCIQILRNYQISYAHKTYHTQIEALDLNLLGKVREVSISHRVSTWWPFFSSTLGPISWALALKLLSDFLFDYIPHWLLF